MRSTPEIFLNNEPEILRGERLGHHWHNARGETTRTCDPLLPDGEAAERGRRLPWRPTAFRPLVGSQVAQLPLIRQLNRRRSCPDPKTMMPSVMNVRRCNWVGSDPLMVAYHDTEWGVPLHDDRRLFEFMVLDAMQAGLNWRIVLQKRQNLAQALDGFDLRKVARYGDQDLERLLTNEGIIRNRQKLAASIANAQAALRVQEAVGSLDAYLWQFVGGRPLINAGKGDSQIPATSPESDAMSKDLKSRGFRFVGPTVCYAFMQAAGLVNDHIVSCFRYPELAKAVAP
jgi:DNA-3-methyladenine glycosylase I